MREIVDREANTALDGLSFLWLEITEKCNLTCSHCYADSSPQGALYGNMDYQDWHRVIDEAAEMGCRELQFIGGEPTLHPRLHDLIDWANHRGFEMIEVFTNATRLGNELLGCFRRNRVHIATSFYSDDPVVHEAITQGRGSWQRTVGGIRAALDAGLPVRVGVIETERNAGHGPRAMDFIKRLGVERVGVDRQRDVGRAGLLQLGGEEERYDELCGQCWKGKLCVTAQGDVFPCVFARATRLGDAKDGLASVLRSMTLHRFRVKVRSIETERIQGANCAPSSCNPGTWCSPYECTPQSGPCSPACSPVTCQPGTGPCYPGGK
jgi:MoaA/NifB/PqqE/SkfB family radical SAM enzyme